MQSVASPTATLVTMLMSTAHFLETVTLAHTTLKYIKQATNTSNVGLCVPIELKASNTPRWLKLFSNNNYYELWNYYIHRLVAEKKDVLIVSNAMSILVYKYDAGDVKFLDYSSLLCTLDNISENR